MGKRSTFERRERDFYPTPKKALGPLLPHLDPCFIFDEPCAGDGAIRKHLGEKRCAFASDIKPLAEDIARISLFDRTKCFGDVFITNPPWPAVNGRGEPTLSMIEHLVTLAPVWMLLSADFAHNVYFTRVAPYCSKIVSVGRVKWIEDSPGPGKDNCAWYLFEDTDAVPVFFPRVPSQNFESCALATCP